MVKKHNKVFFQAFDNRKKDEFRKKYLLDDPADLQLGQSPGLKLMSFQVLYVLCI
jgi:hypothetical protein